ncbi:MAG: GDP-mannose 4,6-dehydratase [Gemmatimonadaceae bacterium]|nr:GDP-mannose 4,6-dehydratase [Gemmatimonadaceae bacterium]
MTAQTRKKRALVTGGAGFIGSHVADLFISCGFDVDIIDDMSTGKRANLPQAARFHEVSVASPEAAQIVRQGRFDVILHVAGQIDVRKSVADPINDATINILGTLNLLEALHQSAKKARFVFTSTGGAIYGDFNRPPNVENFPKDPESPYAISKLSAEYYMAYYGRLHGLECATVRFGNVYGPRQDPHGEAGVVAIFCTRILEGKALTIFGDGTQTRDYVYVGDVANAVWIAGTEGLPPAEKVDARAFNIGTGVGTSVLDLAQMLQAQTGSSLPIEFAPRRAGEQQESFLDVSKARDVLGWTPRTQLPEGLLKSFEWASFNRQAHKA